MDAMIEQEKSSKKKLIIPIVALMLCAVAVIGAGYAISSTVTDDGNTLSANSLSLDLYEEEAGTTQVTTAFFADEVITVETNRTVSAGTDYNVTVSSLSGKDYYLIENGQETSTVTVALAEFTAGTYVTGVTVKMGDMTLPLNGEAATGNLGTLADGVAQKVTVTITLAPVITLTAAQLTALINEIKGTDFDLTFTATVA